MLGKTVAIVAALAVGLAPREIAAQDAAAETPPTAEEMIEVARETWGSPHLRRCPEAKPGEIVVCEPGNEDFSVESSLDEVIRQGRAVPDGLPRAPNVFGLPPCRAYAFCSRIGRAPEPVLMIDLAALPHPLTPEEAALVLRAEDMPQEAVTPEAASPEAAP